jgi:pyruvate dehydrogenase E2 component (dihydrolipoamide acetyltransferase)
MATPVLFPKLGLSMKEGTLSRWRVADGEPIEVGQVIFDLATEKIDAEVEAEDVGVLHRLIEEGAVVQCGEPVAWLLADGEAIPESVATLPESVSARVARAAAGEAADTPSPAATAGSERATAHSRVKASPVAAKLAKSLGIDLACVTGTGPGGRITKEDVDAAARQVADGSSVRRVVPMQGMRAVIAERMHTSLQQMAQLTIGRTVDVTALEEMRGALTTEWSADGIAPTITALLVGAVAKSLGRHPLLNATIDGDELVLLDDVNVGVAVSLPDGLNVPVIRDADERSLREIAHTLAQLAASARAGTLGPDDVSGGTFAVTSLGARGVEFFTPIVNPPNVAILGVGAVRDRAAWGPGGAMLAKEMVLSLSFDHRAVDGAPAAAFLGELADLIESPVRLLV